MLRWLKRIAVSVAVLVGLLLFMQLIPYGRDHTNPPVLKEPPWDSPETRALAVRACFDCHSNQTRWPWYSHVAPTSWVVMRNVTAGRATLNFSEWTRPWDLAPQAIPNVLGREMPPRSYRIAHPEAQLTDAEKLQLAKGLSKTFGLEWRHN